PILLIATSLHAEGVLVPSAGSQPTPNNAPQQTPVPAKPVLIDTPKPKVAEQKPALSDLQKTIVGGQSKSDARAIYISPAQQAQMIEVEKQNLATAQQSIAQLQQFQPNPAQLQQLTAEDRNALTYSQASIQSTNQQALAMVQQSQKRLAILQSGPLKFSDLSKLY
ncbi:MAG: hypothetical protein WAO98_05980, partial [Alphaproteobacteria bacterium]